jgi:hypothetical protein
MAMNLGFNTHRSCISIIPNGIDKDHFNNINANYEFLDIDNLKDNKRPIISM